MNKLKTDNIVKFPENKITDQEKEIEAILFASNEPVHEDDLKGKMLNKNNFQNDINNLQNFYLERGINLIKTGNLGILIF